MGTRATLAIVAAAGLASAASGQNLVQYWQFESDFSNSVVGGTGGVPMGDGVSITNVAGEFFKGTGALKIDHTTDTEGDYLDIPGPGVFPEFLTNNPNGPTSWSVSLWFKFDPTLGPDDDRNFLFETAPDDAVGVGPDTSGGIDEIEWFIGGVDDNNGGGPVVDPDVWNHMVLVYDKANTELVVFYLNGQVVDVRAIGLGQFFSEGPNQPLDPAFGSDSQDDGLHIGNHRAGDGGRNWQGFIDDFAIFDVALGPAQVAALFSGSEDPTTVVGNVANDIATLVPDFVPVAVEPGWTLSTTTLFRGPAGLAYDDANDVLYVGRRFQGDERAVDPANPTETGLDGLYRIDSAGVISQLTGGDNVAGVTVGPDGDIYFCEDFDGISGDGEVLRYNLGTDTTVTNALGFATGDSDPMNVEFIPAGFNGGIFGLDSLGNPFVEPGDAVSVDRGNGGFEEVYVWNPDTNPDAPFVGDDGFGNPNFDEVLLADGLGDDGDGIGYDPATNNNPFDNPGDLAILGGKLYVADEGQDVGGAIWEVTGIDSVNKIALSEPIMPVALIADASTGTLIAVDRDRVNLGGTRVVRIDPDDGIVTTIITNLGGFPGDGGNAGWGSLAISADGTRLFVGDEVSQLGRIYEFTLGAACRADLTGSADPNDPSFGQPDGDADGDDFFFYLDAFSTGDLAVCDLTGSSDPNDPTFDLPDGDCDGDDFFRYLDLFQVGCN